MTKLAIPVLMTLWCVGTCIAQGAGVDTPKERPEGQGLTFDQVLKREDTNRDGQISKSEFRGPPALFGRLDRNGDGMLTREEFAMRPVAGNGQAFRPDADVAIEHDVVYGKGGGRDLKMDLVFPKAPDAKPRPAFVWIHGGGWQSGTKNGGIAIVSPFVRQGFVGATIDYRLTGEAAFPAQIEDCKCAIRFLRAHAKEYGIDPERIAVGGNSAGGHLAALVGTSGDVKALEGTGGWSDQSSRVQAVIDLYGPTDLEKFVTTKGYESHNEAGSPESKLLGGGRVLDNPGAIRRANPITYIDGDDPPFLIMHGNKDGTVAPNQSELLHEALKRANVPSELHVIDGAGHGGLEFARPEILKMQQAFLADLLERVKVPTGDGPPASPKPTQDEGAAGGRPR